jgi:chromosome segregation ATPase
MPERGDDLESRVQRLEDEVVRLKDSVEISRSDAAAARVLAGGADRDVADMKAELRAHTQVLNALRETQLEQHEKLESLDARLSGRIDSLDAKVDQAIGMLQTGMAQIVALLTNRAAKTTRPADPR